VVVAAFRDGVPADSVAGTVVYLSNNGMEGGRVVKSLLHAFGKVSAATRNRFGRL
jgi:hypothetical protein